MTVGTGLASQVNGPWQFIAFYGAVAAAGYTGCGILPVSVHVSRWFPEERGFVRRWPPAGSRSGTSRSRRWRPARRPWPAGARPTSFWRVCSPPPSSPSPSLSAMRRLLRAGRLPRLPHPPAMPQPKSRVRGRPSTAGRPSDAGVLGADPGADGVRVHRLPDDHAPRALCGGSRDGAQGSPRTPSASGRRPTSLGILAAGTVRPGSAPAPPSSSPTGSGRRRSSTFRWCASPGSSTSSRGCSGRRSSRRRRSRRPWSASSSGPSTTARSSARRTSSTTARGARLLRRRARLRPHGQLPAVFLLAALVVVGSAGVTSLARRPSQTRDRGDGLTECSRVVLSSLRTTRRGGRFARAR